MIACEACSSSSFTRALTCTAIDERRLPVIVKVFAAFRLLTPTYDCRCQKQRQGAPCGSSRHPPAGSLQEWARARVQSIRRRHHDRPKNSKRGRRLPPEQRRIVNAQLGEGLADINASRVHGPFAAHEEFIASLHKEARKLSRKKTKRSA
jgi:hypothetical protein